ncbi:MAG: LacI family DNA-binding transcriptional regulator [Rhodobacteraceae bacterium]|nr:LacI family DNA-binding transcriptional regulator [Paracoccaceae bacterium]
MNLKELASKLGLSQTTVSRALNGYPEVSEATRLRVEAAAALHNYQPNVRAKALATGRSMAIAHIVPLGSEHEIVNPVFADFIAGAGAVYAQHGYVTHLSIVKETDEQKIYRDIAAKGTVDGIIVHAPRVRDGRIELLQQIGLPFVVHGRSSGVASDYNWVDVNNRRAFERATNFLMDLGHHRIGLINGIEELDFAARRRAGYLSALASRGIGEDPGIIRSGEMTEHHGYATTRALLGLPDPPTALLASSMIIAFGIRRALDDLGLRLNRDISVIAHDDDLSYFENGPDIPIFTALRSSVRQAGQRVARLLMAQISKPQSGFMQELLEVDFVVGQSTGPARQTPTARQG